MTGRWPTTLGVRADAAWPPHPADLAGPGSTTSLALAASVVPTRCRNSSPRRLQPHPATWRLPHDLAILDALAEGGLEAHHEDEDAE
jgi:hypothetical protein